jgi:hypothetical protein
VETRRTSDPAVLTGAEGRDERRCADAHHMTSVLSALVDAD